ncbi:MAG: hypothetical protein GTN69_10600 [Armatimonadetes bacterium]|nr:hypothetical protein [Armatimonadota bacterium]
MKREHQGAILLAVFVLAMAGLVLCGHRVAKGKPPLKDTDGKGTATAKLKPLIVEPKLRCPKLKPRLKAWILKRLGSTFSRRWRKLVSTRLGDAIVKESKRFKLDPLVMATVAWTESDYRPFLIGSYRGKSGNNRRAGEIGVFQTIPWDHPVKLAWLANVGCKPRQKHLLGRWKRNVKRHGTACHAPDIIRQRSRTGMWSRWELKDIRINAYVAHSEMRYHVERSLKKYPNPRWPRWAYATKWRKRNPGADETLLSRHVTYNTGLRPVPRRSYRYKLLSRYPKVRDYVCGKPRKIARR